MARIQSLPWELPYAMGVAKKRDTYLYAQKIDIDSIQNSQKRELRRSSAAKWMHSGPSVSWNAAPW